MKKITTTSILSFCAFLFSSGFLFSQQEMKVYNVGTLSKAEEQAQLSRILEKATTCAGATAQAVTLQDCSDVGTSGFYTTGTNVNTANSAATAPTVGETCTGAAGYTTAGTWIRLNPDPGVDVIDLQFQSGTGSAGNHNGFVQFFQGTGCGSLTALSCQPMFQFVMGSLGVFQLHAEGINPSQDVWAYIWDDSGKAFNLNWEVIGSSSGGITNDDCASASTGSFGCNIGAGPEAWSGPSANGKVCTGGTWSSNENTTYFQITASATTGTIGVSGITCNDGVAGNAQFGVWNSCACVGTYTVACYRSCAVGSGTLSLSSLTPGQTYILVVDGFAGDICTWNFTTTGIILPVELMQFNGVVTPYGNKFNWTTKSERENDYFILERSSDGESFEEIARLDGAGNSNSEVNYEYLDYNFSPGTNYYRLSQVNFNGQREYFVPKILNNDFAGIQVSPNPMGDKTLVSFGSNYNTETKIILIDALGRTVKSDLIQTSKGFNKIELNLNELNPGAYNLILENEFETRTIKVLRQ